jgi:hypothetical protein
LQGQGDIAAQGAVMSANAWAPAIQNIGAIAGQAVQDYSAQKQQQKQQEMETRRGQLFNEIIGGWDGKDRKALFMGLAQVGGPEWAAKVAPGVAAMFEEQQQPEKPTDPKNFAMMVHGMRGVLEKAGPQYVEQNWAGLRSAFGKGAKELLGWKMPEQYTPELGQQVVQSIQQLDDAWNAPKADTPKSIAAGSFEDYVMKKHPQGATPEQIVAARKEYQQADDRLPASPQLSPTAESNIINRLSNQWTTASKATGELGRQVKLMEAGLEAAKRGDMAAGSQAVLVTFQKILDPTSVVRESEYARSAAGQALLAQIKGAYERLQKGGAGVPVAELEKFARLAREMTRGQMGHMQAVKERIGKTADRYKIPRELVLEDYDFGAALQGNVSTPVKIKSVTEIK